MFIVLLVNSITLGIILKYKPISIKKTGNVKNTASQKSEKI